MMRMITATKMKMTTVMIKMRRMRTRKTRTIMPPEGAAAR